MDSECLFQNDGGDLIFVHGETLTKKPFSSIPVPFVALCETLL
jgi:hypothetical protein